MVVSADHGHVIVGREGQLVLGKLQRWIGTLLKERDGLLWGGWTERTFVLLASGASADGRSAGGASSSM